MTERDATDIYLDEDQFEGQAELEGQAEIEHWREAARRRAEEETRRAARQRRRLMLISGAVALALVLGLVGWKVYSASRAKSADEVALGGKRASVLFQLRAPDGGAAASVVVMHDRAASSGGMLAIPGDLGIDIPGEGVVPFSEALIIAGESLTRDALADLLGATIHGSFTFDPATFQAVVDRLGGVEMPIERAIVIDGETVVEPDPDGGVVRLRGAELLAYAVNEVPGETAADAAERFGAVVRAFLDRIPAQFEATANLFTALGVVGSGTMPSDQLAAILAGAAGDLRAETLTLGTLPVSADGLGALDPIAAAPVVRSVLGGTVQGLSTDGTPRVLVQFGISEEGARNAIRAEVLNSGYRYVDGGELPDALSSPRPTTTITAFGRNGQEAARNLAIAMNMDPSSVKLGEGEGVADVLVVLGADFEYRVLPNSDESPEAGIEAESGAETADTPAGYR